MTNLALAISIDREFAGPVKELVFMGASMNPATDDPEFANTPRHEFNLWFDPERRTLCCGRRGRRLRARRSISPSRHG